MRLCTSRTIRTVKYFYKCIKICDPDKRKFEGNNRFEHANINIT